MQSVLPSGSAWDLAIPRSPDWAFWLGSTADVALQSPARTGSRETAKAAWGISRFWQFASLEIRCQIGNEKFVCFYASGGAKVTKVILGSLCSRYIRCTTLA
jgi:hypothetical protein